MLVVCCCPTGSSVPVAYLAVTPIREITYWTDRLEDAVQFAAFPEAQAAEQRAQSHLVYRFRASTMRLSEAQEYVRCAAA